MSKERFLAGPSIRPGPIGPGTKVTELVDNAYLAYNGARLREACELLTRKMLDENATVGMSLSGALTPAGLGMTCLVPLVEAGFIDWIVSTGANLYHDTHFGIGLEMRRGRPNLDDTELWDAGVVRIYDVVFEYDVLLKTDAFFRKVMAQEEFRSEMGTAEFHWRCGRYVNEREKALGLEGTSLMAAAYRAGVPIYTSSPGDSSIGMNIAEMRLRGFDVGIRPSIDVLETAAIVLDAKVRGRSGVGKGRSAVVILGGGSPKNFVLQTEPQIQEVLGLEEEGHDYYLQVTDARPDTGGLSGATPSEAVSWGKVDPARLPDSVVCYCDTTVALPILTAYAMDRREPRDLARLYDRRDAMMGALTEAYMETRGDVPPEEIVEQVRR